MPKVEARARAGRDGEGPSDLREDRRLLIERLPDIPRWVEARSLLLGGTAEISGLETAGPLAAVLRDPDDDTVFVVGRPKRDAVLNAVSRRKDACDVICGFAEAGAIAAISSDWIPQPIRLQLMAGDGLLPDPDDGDVRFAEPSAIEATPMDPELREELRAAIGYTRIAASFVDGSPVSFCYVGAVTETLWDVSIDTLPEHRRAGHAGRVAAFVIRHMANLGKRPVWAALESNPASWRLGAKLGFVEVDRSAMFEIPPP
jgi:GNAT superfamily N-acetyltransferase